jgi:hypothetical protein
MRVNWSAVEPQEISLVEVNGSAFHVIDSTAIARAVSASVINIGAPSASGAGDALCERKDTFELHGL